MTGRHDIQCRCPVPEGWFRAVWLDSPWHCIMKEGVHSVKFQTKQSALGASMYLSPVVAVSSLVEAGTVNDPRELCKGIHCVYSLLCLGCALPLLLRDIHRRVHGLIQGADPGQELG